MKILYLVRHGEAGQDRREEVSYTPKNEYDNPLTREGIAQALSLNKVFGGIHFDRSFTSDYLRAIETFQQLEITSSLHTALPDIREIFCELIGKNLGNTDLVEFQNQKERVQSFITHQINDIKEGESVLVVAHGCFILYLLRKLLGKSFGHDMTYTGITKLVFNESWHFEYFNNSSHLHERIAIEIMEIAQ